MGNQYGYVRVSTREQNEDRQLIALAEFGLRQHDLWVDKQSGKDFDRPAYRKLLRRLHPGDLVAVKSIDRLGRNYTEILEQWRVLTKEKRADVVVLDMPLLDTRQGKDLTGTFIADLVLQILSYVAQTERENIRQRQAEGIQAARQRGVRFGRPAIEIMLPMEPIIHRWRERKITAAQAAAELGIGERTFYRRVLEWDAAQQGQYTELEWGFENRPLAL